MKIEKISDNQIRCTLSKEDLNDRHLKISELAYGSDKAKALFHELMEQASYECNFEAEDIPLMIEAIPVSPDCLVLVVTKVTDPEELDTRFSSFTSPQDNSKEESTSEGADNVYADEILNCFEHLSELIGERLANKALGKKLDKTEGTKESKDKMPLAGALSKIYSFPSLDSVINLSKLIYKFYKGENTLYKDTTENKYYLVVSMSNHSAEEFNKVCNIISEYGHMEKLPYTTISYFEEHFDVIVKSKAIQVLHKI